MEKILYSNLYNLQDMVDSIIPMQHDKVAVLLSSRTEAEYVELVNMCSEVLKHCRALQIDCRDFLSALSLYFKCYFTYGGKSLKHHMETDPVIAGVRSTYDWYLIMQVVARARVLLGGAVEGDTECGRIIIDILRGTGHSTKHLQGRL